jgi:NADH-quinone oxidoreductase subunit N
VIAVVMSAVSLYYYFRIVVQMYLRDGEEEEARPAELLSDRWAEVMIAVCVVITMVIGVWPAPVVGWAKSAAGALGMM